MSEATGPREFTEADRQSIIESVKSALSPREPAPPKELYAALAKAHTGFKPIVKDREVEVRKSAEKGGGFAYSFRYATLPAILEGVRSALGDNGLFLTQRVTTPAGATQQYVETRLCHISGESIFNLTQMIPTESGQVGYAKAQTYARRYGIALLLCLAAEDDDDGQQPDERATARDIGRPNGANDDPAPVTGKGSTLPPDPELMDDYAKRILSLLDNQDPKGAFVLYDELSDAEQIMLWKRGGLTHKQKQVIRDLAAGREPSQEPPKARGPRGRA